MDQRGDWGISNAMDFNFAGTQFESWPNN